MEIELNKLDHTYTLDEDFTVDLNKYQNKDIVDLKNMHVKGELKINYEDNLEVNLVITGIMVLKDSVTLNPIDHPIDIKIEEEFNINEPYFKEYYEKEQNILDIMAILWENIVLEVPMRLTNADNMTIEGDGWSMGSNENKENEIDPRLAALAELLDERKE